MHSFFFLFTGATWYYHTICLVITYFASFTDYEDDIFAVISNWHVQESQFGGKSKKSLTQRHSELVCFFQVWKSFKWVRHNQVSWSSFNMLHQFELKISLYQFDFRTCMESPYCWQISPVAIFFERARILPGNYFWLDWKSGKTRHFIITVFKIGICLLTVISKNISESKCSTVI